MVKVVGIGTGDYKTLTLGAIEEIKNARRVVLQTEKVPVAEYIKKLGIEYETLDSIYECSEDFDEFNDIAKEIVLQDEDTVLCVLGSAAQNKIVSYIEEHADVEVIPGADFGVCALDRALADTADGILIFSASDFLEQRFLANKTIVITEVDTPYKAFDIKIKLLDFYRPEHKITFVKGNCAEKIELEMLDRQEKWAYDVSIVVPAAAVTEKQGYSYEEFADIIAALRAENGCPWDREQTHTSLRKYLIEEAMEAAEAIDKEDMFMLEDELGDVLLQIALHSQIGEEFGEFTYTDVITGICKKMIRRHAHIFGDDKCETADDVLKNWAKIKKNEKHQKTYTETLKDIPATFTALMRADKIQKRAANAGFDWEDYRGAVDKVEEETRELKEEIEKDGNIPEEMGDLLFAAVNTARLLGLDSEEILMKTCDKFIARFEEMEALADRDLSEMTLAEMDLLWEKAKKHKK